MTHVLASLARRDAFEEAVALLEHAAQACQGSRVAGLDLDQHLIEETAAQLRAALDQAQVIGPEQRRAEVARQVERPPPHSVHLDGPAGAFALDLEGDSEVVTQLSALDLGLDPRRVVYRPH